MIKILKSYFNNKKGMSLVEVLTAMTLLALMIFCFTPLMLSYLNSINASGVKMERVYDESGKLQVLLGGGVTADGYTVSLDTVPVKLTSPTATVNGTSVASATINSNVTAYGLSSAGTDTNALGDINVGNGYSTFYTDEYGSSSGIKLFPSSLTDDFKIAYITIYGNGIKFDDLSKCSVVATGTTGEISLTQGTDYDISYHPDRPNDGDRDLLLLTVYGGGDKISFETSPLVFKYFGQRYEIQVDAPSMIMVGEKSPDNKYYYYVSRGEIEDGNLLIHRREMGSTDETSSTKAGATGGEIKLDAAMNDVEWVSADNADNSAVDSAGNKYGYYIMGGDNGQVRRFWKRPSRTIIVDGEEVKVDGNYYWGGDYTYHTDIEYDYVTNVKKIGLDGDNHKNGMTYGTDVSYKFLARESQGASENYGFVLTSKDTSLTSLFSGSDNKLYSANMWSVTALNDGSANAYYYGTDGRVFSYYASSNATTLTDISSWIGTYDNAMTLYNNRDGDNKVNLKTYLGTESYSIQNVDRLGKFNHEAYTWLVGNSDSYYSAIGVTRPSSASKADSYPITITSVGAITLTGSGGGYSTVNTSANNPDATGATVDTNLQNYPTSSYNLYTGYIPAAMDLWTTKTQYSTSFFGDNAVMIHEDLNSGIGDGERTYGTVTGNIGRANTNFQYAATESNALWKGNIGMTPYLTKNSSLEVSDTLTKAFYAYWKGKVGGFLGIGGTTNYRPGAVLYWPYTNMNYAVTGKFYDSTISASDATYANPELMAWKVYSPRDGKQTYMSNGKVVDVTMAYMSHPFAVNAAANPTDDKVFDQSNDKGDNRIFYWNNRRETITFLDVASTVVPAGENDIPVSLAVGYTMGGLVEMGSKDLYVNTIMNNGIVYIRAGTAKIGTQSSDNSVTGEYYAKNEDAYKLESESNYFQQFYYLNSRSYYNTQPNHEATANNVGCASGAVYWFNNRHIDFVSTLGGQPAGVENSDGSYTVDSNNYNYLRCHPLSNTKVTCVTWGTTWNGNPVAMWGTENGTLLSWKCEKIDDNNDGYTVTKPNDDRYFNDRSVVAEFQSYKWVDKVNNKTFKTHDSKWAGTVGSSNGNLEDDKTQAGQEFKIDNLQNQFIDFFDACSRIRSKETFSWDKTLTGFEYMDGHSIGNDTWKNYGFISVLESVNDIEYSDDVWVACGDQSGKDPANYCGAGETTYNYGTYEPFKARAYTDKGNSSTGSWINVNYWIDDAKTGKQSGDNRYYQWCAVKISDNPNCNIVQVNNVNSMWIATGYIDGSNGGSLNDEYDDGEYACIFWTYDPRKSCNEVGGWSNCVRMYDGTTLESYSDGTSAHVLDEMGGINSCATRDE